MGVDWTGGMCCPADTIYSKLENKCCPSEQYFEETGLCRNKPKGCTKDNIEKYKPLYHELFFQILLELYSFDKKKVYFYYSVFYHEQNEKSIRFRIVLRRCYKVKLKKRCKRLK